MQTANLSNLKAFTLLEVMTVVLLLGLCASAVLWSMADSVSSYEAESFVSAISHADRMARLAGRSSNDQIFLAINLDTQQICRFSKAGGRIKSRSHTLNLPHRMRIRSVIDSHAREHNYGEVVLAYSKSGYSSNYALELKGDKFSSWMVICGSSGQFVLVDNDKDVQELFDNTKTITSSDTD